ncbi:MAG: IPExxxVDY family protein [Bacteroidota bacterium]|nr:IPExxxVDY family protein [Bacteroidota bacterium]
MKHQKLELSEDDFEFELVAFSTNLDDYLLAYHINRTLNIYLQKSNDIEIAYKNICDNKASYQRFDYTDLDNEVNWCLFKNHTLLDSASDNTLFEKSTLKVYFIDEYRNADYILRIEDCDFSEEQIHQIIAKLREIDKVSTVFWVDQDRIKRKENLIF